MTGTFSLGTNTPTPGGGNHSRLFPALVRYSWHLGGVAFGAGFLLGVIDNCVFLDALPHRLLDKLVAVIYSSLLYGVAFAVFGLLFALLSLPFWRRPLSDPQTSSRASFLMVLLFSAGLLFVETAIWYYQDASFKMSITEYVKVHEIVIIGLISLGGGSVAALLYHWLRSFLWCKAPIVVLAGIATLAWLFSLVNLAPRPAAGIESAPQPVKVALIGVDAASWNFLLPWINQGELPHLQRLMQEGTWGVLRSRHPTRSPALWTSIVTGKKTAKHGISHFVKKENGGKVPVRSYHRQARALWNILSDHHRKVWFIDWWASYPPEKVYGVMVTQLIYNEPDSVQPPEMKREIDALIEPYRMQFPPASTLADGDYETLESKYLSELEMAEKVGLHGCGKEWDLFALYTHSTDAVLHHFWKFHEPQRFSDPLYGLTAENIARFSSTPLRHFQRFDQMLGRLLDCFGHQTIVILVSDHGQQARMLKPDRGPADDANISGVHHNDGIFIIRGPGIRKGVLLAQKTVDSFLVELGKMFNDRTLPVDADRMLRNFRLLDYIDIHDITPTILYLMGLPVAEDMDGKVITQAIDANQLEQSPIRFIKTYETGGRSLPTHSPSPADKEMERRLRSLGYIK
jgi:hypothetical protein